MNADTIFDLIENTRSQLENMGLTTQILIGIGGMSLILLFFSLRELINWFLRVNSLRLELDEANAKLDRLLELMEAGHIANADSARLSEQKLEAKIEQKKFRLDNTPLDH